MDVLVALICLALWVYLLCARGGFWLCRERDDARVPLRDHWPPVAAVIPARDEAGFIGRAVASLMAQDYRGRLSVVVVDDGSSDGTALEARQAAGDRPDRPLTVIAGSAPPAGWTGKLWALRQGIEAAAADAQRPQYLLLTDADIAHAPDTGRAIEWRTVHPDSGSKGASPTLWSGKTFPQM
ncbi:MAG TPA: glycosyltransferase, partial [Pseudolabrys sp.]|nr:glycosyltransferase [Pseudolabrys sp.]